MTKVLFVGGDKGSWQVRGVQMSRALGGRCVTNPTRVDWRWADVVVLVKRAIHQWGEAARAAGVPIIWDVLDFWAQPDDNHRPESAFVADVQWLKDHHRVSLLIGATDAMATAIGGVYLPHHSRPGLRPERMRDAVQVVAYEGTPKYLGTWHRAIMLECTARGWSFVLNPDRLASADIVLALRDGKWDGDICRRWKSGVKYVNALAAGRPVITQASSAFSEIGSVGTVVERPADIPAALTEAVSQRAEAYGFGCAYARRYSLDAVAAMYRGFIAQALKGRAA